MKVDQHYVPRLILRKFDERISTYNLKTGKVKISGLKLNNTFSKDHLYSQEIEDLFNKKIESEFANILNNIILKDTDEIVLKRTELNTVKKFLLIAMIRTLDGMDYLSKLDNETIQTLKLLFNFEEKNIENISSFDYWMRTIKCILESNELSSVKLHPEATCQAVKWATIYDCGYLAFWDSSSTKEDFVIIDNGMTSEHEPTRFIEGINNDAIKMGYLIDKIISMDEVYYNNMLMNTSIFTENFYLFSISKNRMIALINPFFRLYDKNNYETTKLLPVPDIWPTRIKDTKLFLKNKNHYVDGFEGFYKGERNAEDKYIYEVKQMNLEDVIYINCLTLDRIRNIMGYSDSSGIKRSLAVYSLVNGLNDYTKLINYFNDMGNSVLVNKYSKELSEHISPKLIKFSEREMIYINHFKMLQSKSRTGIDK